MDAGQPRRQSRRGSRAAAGIARRWPGSIGGTARGRSGRVGGTARGRSGRVGERAALALGVALLLSVPGTGCATGWALQGGRLVDARSGLSIAQPEGGPWRRIDVDGALLTLQRPDGATLSWLRRCDAAAAPARDAAHQLLRALAASEILEEGPGPSAGGATWLILAAVRQDGRAARLHSVTRVAEGCTEDWLLVVPETGAPVTASQREEERTLLEHWWTSTGPAELAAQGLGTDPG